MAETIESTGTIVLRFFRRLAYGFVALLVLAYLGIALMLYLQQRNRIYFPTHYQAAGLAEVRFTTAAGPARGWIVNPGQARAVLYFGGNGEAVARNAEFFRSQLPDRTIYLVPYRGYDGNAGSPTEADLYADALVEYDQIRREHSAVAVIGRSLGTGIATHVASQRPVERVVLVTPYDSLQKVAQAQFPWLPISWLLKDKYESWRRAPSLAMPVTLLVAAQDRLIPPRHAQFLATKFPHPPTVVMIDGAGHNDISTKPAYADFFAPLLPLRPFRRNGAGATATSSPTP